MKLLERSALVQCMWVSFETLCIFPKREGGGGDRGGVNKEKGVWKNDSSCTLIERVPLFCRTPQSSLTFEHATTYWGVLF